MNSRRTKGNRIAWLTVVLLLLVSSSAYAQSNEEIKNESQEEETYDNFFTIVFENDSIGSGTDQNYTNGVRFTYFNVNATFPDIAHTIADKVPTFDINDSSSVYYSFGQNLYTPDDISAIEQAPNDRPWAAFLYVSIGMATKTGNHIDELETTIGVVGPLALGEQVQTVVHKHVTSSPLPNGWDNQLENEPGLILSWQRRWLVEPIFETKKLNLTVSPYLGISLGNVYTYGSTGFTFRLSSEKSKWNDTPLRVRPALPGSGYFDESKSGWGWTVFGGIEGRAVARNIFLDGSTFVNSHSVTKFPIVGDANIGIALNVKRVRLSYTLVLRSKEFKTQDRSDLFGAVTLAYRF
ncbi:MAG: lipid A deacylase LpxR family protein [Nitrospinae bacterium]|nr:lipid A deacylase LpxR family protein [Nitrospinota bacterium]